MASPSLVVRRLVLARDAHRCAACGDRSGLEFQHRQAVGMGGSKKRPEPWEGLTLCSTCNALAEGAMQRDALANGWKVRRWVSHAGLVPVFYAWARVWRVLDGEAAVPVTTVEAARLLRQVYGDEVEEFGDVA